MRRLPRAEFSRAARRERALGEARGRELSTSARRVLVKTPTTVAA